VTESGDQKRLPTPYFVTNLDGSLATFLPLGAAYTIEIKPPSGRIKGICGHIKLTLTLALDINLVLDLALDLDWDVDLNWTWTRPWAWSWTDP
jgi:hypothetical protein